MLVSERRFDVGVMRMYNKDGRLFICTKDLSAPTLSDKNLTGYKILMIVEG